MRQPVCGEKEFELNLHVYFETADEVVLSGPHAVMIVVVLVCFTSFRFHSRAKYSLTGAEMEPFAAVQIDSAAQLYYCY